MKIKLLIDWLGPTIEAPAQMHAKNSVINVLRYPGIRLLKRHQALWIAGGPEDQGFVPVDPWKMSKAEADKMMRAAPVNKEAR